MTSPSTQVGTTSELPIFSNPDTEPEPSQHTLPVASLTETDLAKPQIDSHSDLLIPNENDLSKNNHLINDLLASESISTTSSTILVALPTSDVSCSSGAIPPVLAFDSAIAATEQIETNRSRAPSSRSTLDAPLDHHQPDDDDDAAHVEFQQEIEKIEKESRVARRAFEQRIQKHKIIQEKCEEDIRLLEDEHHTRVAEIRRKQENTTSRRDEEVARVQSEMASRLTALKERKRIERAQLRVLSRKASTQPQTK